MLFRAKPPVSADELEWLLACFSWLRSVLDDGDMRPSLVLPDDPSLQNAQSASELFDAVRVLAGMADWPCRLEQVDDAYNPDDVTVRHEGMAACGSFSFEGGEAVIRYSSSMLRQPQALAATFAHELCHYLLANVGDPPGGPDLMEHSTDCAAAYLGFGVLLANSARSFEQFTDGTWAGWRSSTAGYLSENSLITATAMFAALHEYPAADAEAMMKPYLRKPYRNASKALARDYPELSKSLAQLDLSEWNFA